MAGGDDAVRVGHDRAVVEEDVDVVLRGQQGADVALEDEVRLDRALDRLLDLGVGGVDEVADLAGRSPAASRQRVDVGVDARIPLVAQRSLHAVRHSAVARGDATVQMIRHMETDYAHAKQTLRRFRTHRAHRGWSRGARAGEEARGTSPPTRRIQNLVILGDATQEGDGVH